MENDSIKQYVKNINGYYVKDENAQESITEINTALESIYTKSEVNDLLSAKADTSTTLAGYGIQDAYTKGEIDDRFNLSTFETVSGASITASLGTNDTTVSSIQVAKNDDGSLAKIYGRVKVTLNNNSGSFYVSFPTSLRPESPITISTSVFSRILSIAGTENFTFTGVFVTSLTIATDGTVTSGSLTINTASTQVDLFFQPFLYFIKDFGDTPTPEE